MFLNQEMKKIQESKSRLAICCDLRRQLVHVEVYGIWSGMLHTTSNISLGLAVIDQIIGFLRERREQSS